MSALFEVWLLILQRTDLHRAVCMTVLIYVAVPAAAWAHFRRAVRLASAGIALIIAGVSMMGRHET